MQGRLARKILRGLWHPGRAITVLRSLWQLRQGAPGPPASVSVLPTLACNLRCRMCPQRSAGGSSTPAPTTMLRFEHLTRLLDQVSRSKPSIDLSGGEPTLHPAFEEIVGEIKRRGHALSLATNGSRLAELAERLVAIGVDQVLVSLDGGEETNDQNRGEGAFRNATAGIAELIAARARRGLATPRITLVATVTDVSHGSLSEVADLGLALGVDGLILSHLRWYTDEVMRAQARATREHLSECFDPAGLEAYTRSLETTRQPTGGPVDPGTLLREIRRIGETLAGRIPFVAQPGYDEDEVRRYYSAIDYRRPAGDVCRAVFRYATLTATGDFAFCMGYSAGNVETTTLDEVWRAPRTRHFFKTVYRLGRFPMCHRCCN
ncbi:MAG: radical SAM protein [Candidatus Riflebacteria bacterium]|nr:radical SAM protein [Candidatus Riflebacteria bacterium]